MSEFEVARLASYFAEGFYAHMAALSVAAHDRAPELLPAHVVGTTVPVNTVRRKDGTEHAFHGPIYLERAATGGYAEHFRSVWLTGSLLALGDALHSESYFDHAAELEMIYHLRNGVAHGNVFNITAAGLSRLGAHPANTFGAIVKSDLGSTFEVTPSCNGTQVLFDFMEAADVVDLLMSVSLYLGRVSQGLPGHR